MNCQSIFARLGLMLITVGTIATSIHNTARAELYINELFWDAGGGSAAGQRAGDDNRDEYIEMRGTANMSLANHYLIFLEGEDNDLHTGMTGQIEGIFDLGSHLMGSNGFLTIRQKNNLYNGLFGGVAAGTTDVVNTGSGTGYGDGASSSIGHLGELGTVGVENGGWTAMLIKNNGDPVANKPTIGLDLDVGNNGLDSVETAEGNWRANWEIIDAIGILTEGTEAFYGRTYAQVNFGTVALGQELFPGGPIFTTPNIEPGATYTYAPWSATEAEIEYAARWGNSTGQTPYDWHLSNVTQRLIAGSTVGAPDYRQSGDPHPANASTPPSVNQVVESTHYVPYRTALLDTLGEPNYPLNLSQLPWDYNHDGTVDAADYTVWRDTLGQTGPGLAADFNGDQAVTQKDYEAWKYHFGLSLPPGAGAIASTVPEPATLVLFAVGSLGAVLLQATGCRKRI